MTFVNRRFSSERWHVQADRMPRDRDGSARTGEGKKKAPRSVLIAVLLRVRLCCDSSAVKLQ
jgi:hypothetical protein